MPDAPQKRPQDKKELTQDYATLFWDQGCTFLFPDFDAVVEDNTTLIQTIRPQSFENLKDPADFAKFPYIFALNPHRDLVYSQNERLFYYWNGRNYYPIDDANAREGGLARLIRAFLKANIGRRRINLNTALVSDVRTAIVTEPVKIFVSTKAPTRLAIRDGTLDFNTFTVTDGHDQERPAFRYLDVDSTLFSAPTPAFDQLLRDAFPDDPEMHDFILQMLAYYFIPQDKEPACFFLYGVAASGKSTLLDLIRDLLSGPRFYSASSLQAITTDKFVAANLAGKLANIYDEDESGYVDLGKLKGLVSHTPTDAQRKFQDVFLLHPFAKFIFASNQFPNFAGIDQGMMRRIYPIEFLHSTPEEKRDKDLKEKLRSELSGIVGKIIRAAQAFVSRGQRFLVPASVKALKEDFRSDNNPVIGFILENFTIPSEAEASLHIPGSTSPGTLNPWVPTGDLYTQYEDWVKKMGHKPVSHKSFTQILKTELPNIAYRRTNRDRYRALIPKNIAASMVRVPNNF